MIWQEVAVTTTPPNSAYRRGRGNRFELLSGDEARPLQNLPKNSKVSKQQRLPYLISGFLDDFLINGLDDRLRPRGNGQLSINVFQMGSDRMRRYE